MPFKLVKKGWPKLEHQISVGPFNIRIGVRHIHHFKDKRVQVYLDRKNALLGLKPVDDTAYSYSLQPWRAITMYKCSKKIGVKVGRYPAEWNEEKKMLVAKVELIQE